MRQTELSPRLRMVADLVPQGPRGIWLADIGTDHAYLPVWLLQHQGEDLQLAHVIAADLRSGPLERAMQTAREAGCMEDIDFRQCDGLAALDSREAEVIVIAGMGGETIAHILKEAPWTDWTGKTLVLQPMSSMPELREWLQANGFCIEQEKLSREGNSLYTALLVRVGEMEPLSPAQLWVGRNSPDPLRGVWLDHWLQKLDRALDGLGRAKKEGKEARRIQLEQVRAGLLDMKKEWNTWQM